MPGQTNREMITTLTGGCGRQCHTYYINPLGFAFENFDGMGRLRTIDNGKPVDTAAAYPFAEGYKPFAGAADLMQLMASSKQAHACYAKKIAGYALQRDIVQSDLATLDALSQVSMAGGSIKQVMLALVQIRRSARAMEATREVDATRAQTDRASIAVRSCAARPASRSACRFWKACPSVRHGRRTRSRPSACSCARPTAWSAASSFPTRSARSARTR